MTAENNTSYLIFEKAIKAYKLACVAIELNDWDGASNRAYYAMFNAARAALIASGAPVRLDFARTHSGLISAFSNYLVRGNQITKEIAALLGMAQDTRLMADYKDESVSERDAKEIVSDANLFIETIREKYFYGSGEEVSKTIKPRFKI